MYDKRLDTFIEIVRTGSFAKAAEKLFITNTAVMKQMNLLECDLHLHLLLRSNKGIRLTEAGTSLYQDALKVVEFSKQALVRAHKYEESHADMIRIGTSFLNPSRILVGMWSKIREKHPEFTIEIVPFDDNNEAILNVLDSLGDKFDLIAGTCSSALWLKHCHYYPLQPYYFTCLVANNHPLAKKKHLSIQDLYGETLMLGRRGDSQPVDLLRDDLLQHHQQITLEDIPCFYDMETFNRCERSQHVLLALPYWQDIHPGLTMLKINWKHSNSYGILYAKNPSDSVRRFLHCLQE